MATEDAVNKAAEAKNLCQKLIKRLHGNGDAISSHSLVGATSQNVGNLRQFQVNFSQFQVNFSCIELHYRLAFVQSMLSIHLKIVNLLHL